MAYDFKKLADVEALTEVPEGATVLAEVGGQVKRIPGEGLGGGGFTVVFTITEDEDSGERTVTCDKTFEECLEAFNNVTINAVLCMKNQPIMGGTGDMLERSIGFALLWKDYEAKVARGIMFAFDQGGNIAFNPDGTIEAM